MLRAVLSTAFCITGLLMAAGQTQAGFIYSGPSANNVDTNPATQVVMTVLDACTITDLNLSINIVGGHMEDFDVFLTSPGATTVQVHIQQVSHMNNFNITFDDEAANPNGLILAADGVGTFQPFQALSAFDGEGLAGNWTLSILDDSIPNENNNLLSWSISGECATAVPEPASLTLVGLGAFGLTAGAIRRRRQQKAAV